MYRLVKALVLPPTSLFLLLLFAWWLRGRAGRALAGIAFAGLWILSMPAVAVLLLDSLASEPVGQRDPSAQAIVILSGHTYEDPELGEATAGSATLERLRLGVRLHRETNLPILVTGGTYEPDTEEPAARAMERSLRVDFDVPVRWIEDQSRTTAENAFLSAPILREDGIEKVYLVSDFTHLPRARRVFESVGLEVIPVGAGDRGRLELRPLDFVPSARGLERSTVAVHEWLGRVWYRLRYGA